MVFFCLLGGRNRVHVERGSHMYDSTRVAFVTGASRGIGKAIAVHLARAGFDIALGARTVHEGEAREHSSTVKRSDTSPLPGSLDSTAALVEAEGRQALSVYLDITDRTTLGSSVTTVLERWGRIDVLVNNARYVGPGHMDRLMETPVHLLDAHLEGNVMAPIVLTKLVMPQMIERGSGIVITITSGSGRIDPPVPAGEGGWGLGYGMSKGAVHRLVGIVKVEHEGDGILAFNLHPGYVVTERIVQDMGSFGFDSESGAPPDVIGAAAAWLCTAPEARELNGQWVEGQNLCADLGLLPGWSTPSPVNLHFGPES
jgi:NAD(P)-dependent dehydrogenase (short-subunit alcohol dehydrogenase family)